jgi:iron complex transport system ATP-binding protein
MIALERLRVRLGGRTAVDGVSLAVRRGGWTTLIGPNGAGKTTVLRAIAGLVGHAGRIVVDGRDLRGLPAPARARAVAMVPQEPVLPAEMSVGEYVMLGRTPHLRMLGRAGPGDLESAAAAMARLQLESLAGRRLAALSGGERQRAVIARAVAQESPVLLLDEPTTALDLGRQQDVLALVDELRAERRLTVIGAMHDLTLAARYGECLVLLDRGAVVARGAPDQVVTEELIGRHYRARVSIARMDGVPVVVPVRAEARR